MSATTRRASVLSIMDAVTHASGVDQDFTDAAWPRQCELRPAGFMQALQVLMDRRIETLFV
jgi:hypothetical protein